jgi:hypothetical protein
VHESEANNTTGNSHSLHEREGREHAAWERGDPVAVEKSGLRVKACARCHGCATIEATKHHSIRPPKARWKTTEQRNGLGVHTHREIVWVCRPIGTDVRLRLVQCVWKSPPTVMTREHCADTVHTRPRAINSVGSPAKHGGIPSRALAAKHEELIHTLCAIKSLHQIIKSKRKIRV